MNISMFLGYSYGATKSQKLNMLVDDSSGHALLNSGCSKTVRWLNWFEDYICMLSDYDRSCIVESESDSSFTFDAAECNVPLLMSEWQ